MINRRQFISTIGVLGLTGTATAQDSLINSERIRPGDKVGLVNPATAAFESEPIEIMIEALESLDLEVVPGNNYYNRHGYFAGTDTDRAY